MLQSLTIRDVLLISSLHLEFQGSFSLFTGETGAGKSILLEALGLVLGERAQANLVRIGTPHASVTAAFTLVPALKDILASQGLSEDPENPLIVRRVLLADGRSRAYVNDTPVSIGFLKELGHHLVDIHGQFDHLLDPTTHRDLLDQYGNLSPEVYRVQEAYAQWQTLESRLQEERKTLDSLQAKRDFLDYAVEELTTLDPHPGEEDALLETKIFLSQRAKIEQAVTGACSLFTQDAGIQPLIHKAYRFLERLPPESQEKVGTLLIALDRLALEAQEITTCLDDLQKDVQQESDSLDTVEERLYALRGMARKYQCSVEDLARKRQEYQEALDNLEQTDTMVVSLEKQMRSQEASYRALAQDLSKKRHEVAHTLSQALRKELPPLKLESAGFCVSVNSGHDSTHCNAHGMDHVEFLVQTNPGTPQGPLRKIASGGERSRFMLALKVILHGKNPIPTLVFDEIDAGVGGAVAMAMGERLQRLSEKSQILVVTHAPQVACFGEQHFKVLKAFQCSETQTQNQTQVILLNPQQRQEELARMLSGKTITAEARAAAAQLLNFSKDTGDPDSKKSQDSVNPLDPPNLEKAALDSPAKTHGSSS